MKVRIDIVRPDSSAGPNALRAHVYSAELDMPAKQALSLRVGEKLTFWVRYDHEKGAGQYAVKIIDVEKELVEEAMIGGNWEIDDIRVVAELINHRHP